MTYTDPKINQVQPSLEGLSLEEIAKEVTENKHKYNFVSDQAAEDDSMDQEDCLNVMKKYSILHGIPTIIAITGIVKLIQDGGTNQSKTNLTVKVNDYEIDLNKLRNVLQSHSKKLTVRKLAKGARKAVIAIALNYQWPGPLTKELSRNNPNLVITPELAPWCNEIHSDNYDCPNEIRDALVRREEQFKILFKTVSKTNNQKPRRLRGRKNNKGK